MDWEKSKVTEKNLAEFMDLDNLKDTEDPTRNLAELETEMARPNLHPAAQKALAAEHKRLTSQVGDLKWEKAPATGSLKWERASEPASAKPKATGPAVPFKSGSAFEETKSMIPGVDDMKEAWHTFQKQWANRDKTPMTPEVAGRMMNDEKGAGAGVLDTVGAIPAMLAGAGHGIYDAITSGDTTQGLKTAGETMQKFLPSTLLPETVVGKEPGKSEGYKAAMVPVTMAMDVLNAIPQGYGEILNEMGEPEAAAQVSDGGKLAIMAAAAGAGGKGIMKGFKNNKAKIDPAAKLEALKKRVEEETAAKEPTAQEIIEGTTAHADDFGVINPYDVAGRVTEAKEGRAPTIDEPQGDLFGSENLQEAQKGPDMGQESIRHDSIPYEETSPLALEPKAELPTRLQEMGKELNEFDRPYSSELGLEPMEQPVAAPVEAGPSGPGTRDVARAKARELEMEEAHRAEQEATRQSEIEAAHAEVIRMKNSDFGMMEGMKELDFVKAIEEVEKGNSPARRAFLDRANLDFQEVQKSGDKTLMDQGHTITMRGQLRMGDVAGALKTLAEKHPNAAYRELATWMQDKLEGVKVKLHQEPVVRMGEREVTGYYDPTTNTVGLSGLGATSPHTVLHELSHALSSKFMNERPSDVRVVNMRNLFTLLGKTSEMNKKFPGIVNPKEFLAEAMSNPTFQKFLKEQRMNNRTVWERFVDNVRSMLGLEKGSRMATAFEHSLDLAQQIIEAQTGKGEVLEQFKKAGMPNRLADLMAQAPHDLPTKTRQFEGFDKAVRKIPGLESPISDFTFYDKPLPEIIKMAQEAADIPEGAVEKFAQQMQGGALFESLKTRNPVVKYTYERITRAFQEASHQIKVNLTDPVTGLKARMRDLTPDQKGEIHAAMMMFEGKRELTAADLAADGFNEKQIAYAMRHRELDNQFFKEINERREALGMVPMDKRVAHIAGRFMGDFSRMVFKEVDGVQKVVGRISGSTKWELDRAAKYIAENNPDFIMGKQEYNGIGKGRAAKDKFAGMMEAINFLEKTDVDVKVLLDSYQGYLQQDAVNYLNATRHAKAKVKQAGGIIGSEGNKPWRDAVANAEEGMKAQLAYYEQGYQWMAMEKATRDIKQLIGDEGVVKNAPRAAAYADQYVKHSMGREQGSISDALNSLISTIGENTGIGHSNIMKLNNAVKHRIMQKFMGFINIPFSVTQLMQPLQTQPAMIRLMRSRGLEFSTAQAQAKAMNTYLHSFLEDHGVSRLPEFDSAALKYAQEKSIFDVKMADHTKDINQSKVMEKFDKVADINITAPEHLTRGATFLFYSHMLKDAGIPVKDIFGAAENMTNMSMVNYHQIERPMGYAKLGWIGDVASTLTRYKHNQWSQLAFYAREGIRGEQGAVKSMAPLATFLSTSLAFGGVMGFFAYQEADAAYQLLSESVGKPDSITNHVLKDGPTGALISHGLFAQLGMDMTSRFSNANAIPDSIPAALMPYGSAVLDMAATTGRWVMDPTNMFKAKQMGKSFAPQSVQGILENQWFTEKSVNGKDLYVSPTLGPNMGKGRVERTESAKMKRNFGFRDINESKELAKNYSDSQIAKQHANIADRQLQKAKDAAMNDSLTEAKLQQLAQRASEHGMSPDKFVSQYTTWAMDRKLPQSQQMLLRNAKKGFTGAFNINAAKGR